MKQLYQKVRHYLETRNLDQKILLLTFSVLVVTCMVILLATTISSFRTITEQSRQLTEQQLSTISKNTEISLEGYDELMRLLVLEDYIQEYLNAEPEERGSASITRDAFASILNIRNTKQNVNYIAVISEDEQSYIYSGNTLKTSDFVRVALADYEYAYSKQVGSMRYSVTRALHNPSSYSLNLYRPIYDQFVLGKKIGLLCMSLDTASLTQFYQSQPSESGLDIAMTDQNGIVLSSVIEEDIGKQHDFVTNLSGIEGTFDVRGKMCMYHEISGWNFYLVGTVPLNYLLRDAYSTLLLLVVLVIVSVTLSIWYFRKNLSTIYAPLNDIRSKMNQVAGGNFDVRVSGDGMGEDIKQMVENFNQMVVRLEELMEEVKEEQHQIEQIELNALQSQIKPHFLYNTLDCIHWQALVDGNEQISTLVKALANYYRLCLSRGQDVIPLSQELAHIENYLIIQNLRYGDIIQSEWNMPESIKQTVLIPKMTLQPLVENSIYHGIKVKNGQSGTVRISAKRDGDSVLVSVADSGNGVSDEEILEMNNSISEFDESFGYGVRNVHKRIEILFGKGYGLHYSKNKTGGLTVSIRLPYRLSDSEQE